MSKALRILLAFGTVIGAAAHAANPVRCFEQFLPFNEETRSVDTNVFIGEMDSANPDRWKTEPVFLGVSKYGGDVSCFHFSDFFYRNRAHLHRARCEIKILGDNDDPYAIAHFSVGTERDWLYLGTGSVEDVQARAEHEQDTCERVLAFVKMVVDREANPKAKF